MRTAKRPLFEANQSVAGAAGEEDLTTSTTAIEDQFKGAEENKPLPPHCTLLKAIENARGGIIPGLTATVMRAFRRKLYVPTTGLQSAQEHTHHLHQQLEQRDG